MLCQTRRLQAQDPPEYLIWSTHSSHQCQSLQAFSRLGCWSATTCIAHLCRCHAPFTSTALWSPLTQRHLLLASLSRGPSPLAKKFTTSTRCRHFDLQTCNISAKMELHHILSGCILCFEKMPLGHICWHSQSDSFQHSALLQNAT